MQAAILHELLTRSSLTCMRGLEGKEAEFIAWMRQQLGNNERWGGAVGGRDYAERSW